MLLTELDLIPTELEYLSTKQKEIFVLIFQVIHEYTLGVCPRIKVALEPQASGYLAIKAMGHSGGRVVFSRRVNLLKTKQECFIQLYKALAVDAAYFASAPVRPRLRNRDRFLELTQKLGLDLEGDI